MRKAFRGFGAAMTLSLAACGTEQAENNLAAEDVNAMMNLEELPPAEPAADAAVEEKVTDAPQQQSAVQKPAAAKPAPPKAKPAPEPKPAPDAHAGHDMNNMN